VTGWEFLGWVLIGSVGLVIVGLAVGIVIVIIKTALKSGEK
jgi:preprotein translocase subunit Sss1